MKVVKKVVKCGCQPIISHYKIYRVPDYAVLIFWSSMENRRNSVSTCGSL